MNAKAKDRVDSLGTKNLLSLIISMSIPAVCGNVTTAFYNVVDRLFVGQYVGRNALGAIGLMFPLNNVSSAICVLLTVGGGALVSLSLGKQDKERADNAYTNILTMGFVLSLFVAILLFVFADPLITVCGAGKDSSLHNLGVEYLRITAIGQFFHIMNLGIAGVIRAEGNVKYSMVVTIIGAILNIALDVLLVAVIPFGLVGAGIATAISQVVGASLSMMYFIQKKSVLRWAGIKNAKLSRMITIMGLGIAPAVFQVFGLVNNLIMNNSLMKYGNLELGPGGGELAISALSVINTVESISLMIVLGMNNALSTIISYNYGAGKYNRARNATLIGQAIAMVICTIVWAVMMFCPDLIFRWFSSGDRELLEYGVMAMRKSKGLILFLGFQTLASMYYSAIGKPKVATVISISRNGLFLIPSLFLLPRFLGIDGVLYSSMVSDGCSMVVVSIIYFVGIYRISKKEKQNKDEKL